MNEENRRSPRQRTYKGGSILLTHLAPLECIVRNLSDTGACLEVPSASAVPDSFTLLIKPELRKRSCQVMWRSGQRVGVRFA